MFGLFRKTKYNSVIKFSKFITRYEALSTDNRSFVKFIFDFIDSLNIGPPTHFSVMGPYPDRQWKTKNGFIKSLEKKDYRDIVYLFIQGDNFALHYDNDLVNNESPPKFGTIDFDLEVRQEILSLDELITFGKKVDQFFSCDYGYAFLSNGLLGCSESNTRETWYGLTSSSDPNESKWHKEKFLINEGKIKNLFEFNFLSTKYCDSLIKSLSGLSSRIIVPYSGDLVSFKVNQADIPNYRLKLKEWMIIENSAPNTGPSRRGAFPKLFCP